MDSSDLGWDGDRGWDCDMGLGEGNSDAMRVMGILGWLFWSRVAVERARTPAPTIRASGGGVRVFMVVCLLAVVRCGTIRWVCVSSVQCPVVRIEAR